MLKRLKEEVCAANLELVRRGLVIETWGNASAADRETGCVVIKPSGVPYDRMKPKHMVVVELQTGEVVEGDLNPSSDTATHLALYRAFEAIGGVIHTHSLFATAWAQAKKPIPALGTTHADYFYGPIPCSRPMRPQEIEKDYEANTGAVIVETFRNRSVSDCPGVLVASHGPFAWGPTVAKAVENAYVLEHLARLASETLRIAPGTSDMQTVLLKKHFFRKHGAGAYYGQKASASTTKTNPKAS
jgi:L-ribulose-5-phosphate 4-epimerase